MMKQGHFRGIIFLVLIFLTSNFSVAQEILPEADDELMDTLDVSVVIEPEYKYDYIPDVSADEIRERIHALPSVIKLSYNDKVAAFVNYFTIRNRDYTRLMIQRRNLYFPLFEKYLTKHNLPDELKYLAIVESGLNPKAGSWAGAIGLWQFMPGTGKMFRLHQDFFIDERMNPEKATEAACLYLKELYSIYNDWGLALASYNCGPGTIRRAIRKSGGQIGDFWQLYPQLPKETRSYFPQFIAVMYAMNFAQEHNLMHGNLDFKMETDTIHINDYLNLEVFAANSEICLEDLNKLNPELKKNAVPKYATNYPLIVPADKKEVLREQLPEILVASYQASLEGSYFVVKTEEPSFNTKTYHIVKKGEVLGSIANKYKVSVSQLKTWNNLKNNNLAIGQKLVVKKNVTASQQTQNTAVATKAPTSNTSVASNTKATNERNNVIIEKPVKIDNSKFYIVQPGDTLWQISQKLNGMTIEKLKKLNGLKNSNIKPGQKLVIG